MSNMLRDIAVFFDASDAGQRILEIAARLAGRQSAHLIGICSTGNYAYVPEDAFVRGAAMHEVVLKYQAASTAQLLQAGQNLVRVATAHGANPEFRVIPYSESGGNTALHGLYSDLLVVGHPVAPGAPIAWSSIQLLQQAGTPLLIVPNTWTSPDVGRRITVAWNASRQARRAVADALPLLITAQVVDLLIIDPERETDRHGEEPGADMAAYLARHGVTVELVRTGSQGQPIAETIIEHARNRDSDLIVFGAYSRSQIREAVFGGVTRTLMADVPLPLFVSH